MTKVDELTALIATILPPAFFIIAVCFIYLGEWNKGAYFMATAAYFEAGSIKSMLKDKK